MQKQGKSPWLGSSACVDETALLLGGSAKRCKICGRATHISYLKDGVCPDLDCKREEILKIFADAGAVIAGSHIICTSGKHSASYVDKDAIYPHTRNISRLCYKIAEWFADDNVEVVVAPEKEVLFSQWSAHHLSELTGREIFAFYAEKETIQIPDPEDKGRICYRETGQFIIKRGGAQHIIQRKNVLVVEDILTTGGSAKKVIEVTRATGGNVVGLGALCNRGGVTPQDVANPSKFISLVNVKLDAWDKADCPLCAQNIPINTDVGKGREYLARKKRVKK